MSERERKRVNPCYYQSFIESPHLLLSSSPLVLRDESERRNLLVRLDGAKHGLAFFIRGGAETFPFVIRDHRALP